ncbi:MAG TPA: beta-propeller domain-containing protein [Acidimicrobiales bacterium]|nr:beta-propeller domain-containing protein [Acidimicrobiales bacterium]
METRGSKRARRNRRGLAVLAALAVAGGACTDGDDTGKGPEGGAPTFRLASALTPFAACGDLQEYLRTEAAKLVGPYGLGGGARDVGFPMPLATTDDARSTAAAGSAAQESSVGAPPPTEAPKAGVDYSGTNVQEAGVDEPDLVKTDGRRLVTMAGGRLRILDLTGDSPRVTATLPIAQQYQQAELLLEGDRVLVLHAAEPQNVPQKPAPPTGAEDGVAMIAPVPDAGRAQVTVVDIADLGSPKVVAEVKMDGSLVTARMVDGVARLVLRSGPPRIGFAYPTGNQESFNQATATNKAIVEKSTVEDWLPTYSYSEPGRAEAASSGQLVGCNEVARPSEFSGLGMVSVLSVDAKDPRPGPAATVLGAGETVYASNQNLYVTTSRWSGPVPLEDTGGRGDRPRRSIAPDPGTSDIHKFDISDKVRTRYLASGNVPGRLLNQFSMSELEGDLRVATTTEGIAQGRPEAGVPASESRVSVLRQDGDKLATIGSVGGLGKGERIFAVRFLGDRGYVVTFRQTDPLYVIDLDDPARPAVRGELKIPGYSAYLHPVGDHRLIGVGQDATDEGRSLGTQVSLFDVSDPGDPKRLAHTVLPRASSEAELDHRAFLYWAKTGLTLLPVQSHGDGDVIIQEGPSPEPTIASRPPDRGQQFVGAVGFTVGETEVKELGRIRHRGDMPIRRSLVVNDSVLTLSEDGLMSSDLQTLGGGKWLAF